MSKYNKKLQALKVSKGIDRQIAKENGMLSIWRGRATICSSIKKNSRQISKKKAIKDSSEN